MFTFICCCNDLEIFNKYTNKSIKEAEKWAEENKLPKPQKLLMAGTSMSQVYNQGIAQAIFDIKIFIHQDVDLLNTDWIPRLLHTFANREVGMIGLVGTTKLPERGPWWAEGEKYIKGKVLSREEKLKWFFSKDVSPVDVLDIDGFFMATNTGINFDEKISAFQFYGMSYCRILRSKGYKIKVLPHLSWHVGDKKALTERLWTDKLMDEYYNRIKELNI